MFLVSIRIVGGVEYEDKARECGWKRHPRLSIEDPFEVGYDVAHVIKEDAQHALTREFARSYSLLATAFVDETVRIVFNDFEE